MIFPLKTVMKTSWISQQPAMFDGTEERPSAAQQGIAFLVAYLLGAIQLLRMLRLILTRRLGKNHWGRVPPRWEWEHTGIFHGLYSQQYDILGLVDLNMGYGINICQSGFKPSILGDSIPKQIRTRSLLRVHSLTRPATLCAWNMFILVIQHGNGIEFKTPLNSFGPTVLLVIRKSGDIFTTKRGAVPPISVLPSGKLTVCDIENGPLIVDLAINSMVIFYSYVSPHKNHGDVL